MVLFFVVVTLSPKKSKNTTLVFLGCHRSNNMCCCHKDDPITANASRGGEAYGLVWAEHDMKGDAKAIWCHL